MKRIFICAFWLFSRWLSQKKKDRHLWHTNDSRETLQWDESLYVLVDFLTLTLKEKKMSIFFFLVVDSRNPHTQNPAHTHTCTCTHAPMMRSFIDLIIIYRYESRARDAEYRLFYRALLQTRPIILRIYRHINDDEIITDSSLCILTSIIETHHQRLIWGGYD